jgi:hypothetical protein
MTLDASGNLGLGVTPSAWGAPYKAFQVGTGIDKGGVFGRTDNSNEINFGVNWEYLGGASVTYVGSSFATNYTQKVGEHRWLTAPSGTAGNAFTFTQAMTLDASGNLGIGLTPPANSAKALYISGYVGGYAAISAGASGGDYGRIGFGFAITSTSNTYTYANGDFASQIGFASGGLQFFTAPSGISGNTITFTQAMTLDNSGNLLVGTTSGTTNIIKNDRNNDQTLYVQNANNSVPFGIYINYPNAAPNSTSAWFVSCRDSGTNRMQVYSNGGIANFSGNDVNLSDRREKINFSPAKSYLDVICAIPVQTFNYIDQSEDDPGLTLGVVAQDVQAVAPELVLESNWGTVDEPKMRLSIYQTDFQYALMKCIQEQQGMIQSLTDRITQLENKL